MYESIKQCMQITEDKYDYIYIYGKVCKSNLLMYIRVCEKLKSKELNMLNTDIACNRRCRSILLFMIVCNIIKRK